MVLFQKKINYVPQNIFLRDNTIASNVAFGEKEENFNFDKINEALETAYLYNFIRSELPNGLDTLVGDKGIKLSGGQKQRVGIARAISVGPKVLICDESVSALDVSVQAQVLNLLNHLKKKLKLTYIFISHDLSVVKYMADKIVVMKEGVFKEIGFSEDIYNNPKMEYTKRLIEAIPKGVS